MNQCVQEFLKKALAPVKYKKMHPYLAQELNDHIESLKEELMDEGLDEERAYEKAVVEMGEPEQIGTSLHQIHKPKVEWRVILMMLVVIGVGVFALDMLQKWGKWGEYYADKEYFAKQISFIILGIVAFFICYFMDYRKVEKVSALLYILGAMLSIVTLTIGWEVNGIKTFLKIGPILIRTTLVAMPLFTISYVAFVRKWANKGNRGYSILGGIGIFTVVLCMFIAPVEALYMAVVLMSIFVMYMMSKAFKGDRKKVIKGLVSSSILGLAFAIWYICHSPQRVQSIMIWLNPKLDPIDEGYVYTQIREILSGAAWFGKGAGSKIEEMDQYLPQINVDFIFTFIIGAMGYLVGASVLVVISIMLIRCFKASKYVNDEYGKMLLKGISIFFAIQYIISVLVNTSLLPITATSIPFISSGGSRMICDMALMGFALGIYRRKDIVPCELLKEEIIEEEKNKKYNSMILSWALHILRSSDEIEAVNITFKEK